MRRGLLVVAGLTTAILYVIAVLRIPWWRYGDRLVAWSELLGGGQRPPAALLIGLGALIVAYIGGWWLVATATELPGVRTIIWIGAIVYAVTLVGLMPFSADLFTYLSQAHALTDLHINPLVEAPLSRGIDAVLAAYGTNYLSQPSAYGPAWLLLSTGGTWGAYDIGWGVLYLKGLCLAAFFGCIWSLDKLLRNIKPDAAVVGLYLFAWNPLVLLMAVGDAHNDVVMMLGVLLALWLLLQDRWVLAFMVLTLSLLVKYVSIIFVIPFALYTWQVVPRRERVSTLLRASLATAAVLLLVSLPLLAFGEGRGLSDLWIVSLVLRFMQPSNWPQGYREIATWVLVAGAGLFLASYGILLWRFVAGRSRASRPDLARLLDLGFYISLLAFVLGAARAQPWHLIWPAALAGLSSRRWAWPLIVGLSVVLLVGQVWVEWGAPGLSLQN